LDGGHHLVAGTRVRDWVNRYEGYSGEPGDDRFDRGRGEVLAVDP
jgi:hypothetical protein